MQNKLQELTDKLYNEGLSKGKQEGDNLVAKAKAEAEEIVKNAKLEAERIIAEAQKNADDLKMKVAADVKMAAAQSMTVTKQEMEKLIVAKASDAATTNALSSADFVKEVIKSVVAAFNPANAQPVDLDIILPEKLKEGVEPFVANEVARQFAAEITVSYSKKINAGFKVAPKNGGYSVQFTDEEFKELISSYLRPATKKILFG